DAKSATVTVQRRQGFFVMNQPVPLYYFPTLQNFPDHPISEGLEEVLIQFGSPITIVSSDSSLTYKPIALTSEQSGKIAPPTFFNPEQEWTLADFANGRQTVGVALEGRFGGENKTKMVVIGDGDFPLNEGQQPTNPDNVNLLVNAIDWLTDGTGLMALRTQGVRTRPIEQQLSDGTRSAVKWGNFLLPILIIVIVGLVRFQGRKLQRVRWQAEDYS
ncbi:MAG: hypothetical protein AAFV07_16180, partial [Bacteroidota bacterium]